MRYSGENVSNGIDYLHKNVNELGRNSIIINFTYLNDDKFLGVPLENHPEIVYPISVGDYFMLHWNQNFVYSCILDNDRKKFNSHSSIEKLLGKLSNNKKIKFAKCIYLNLQNLEYFNKNEVIKLLLKHFNNTKIIICTKRCFTLNGGEIAKAYASSGSFLSPIVEGKIFDINVEALVDSGAQSSLIQYEFVKKHNLSIDESELKSIVGISGNRMDIKGVIKTNMCLGEQEVGVQLNIVDCADLETPLLLGMDTLVAGKFKLDFNDLSIYCKGELVSQDKTICEVFREVRSQNLEIKKKIEVKPGNITNLQFKTNLKNDAFSIKYLNPFLKRLNISCLQNQCGAVSSIDKGTLNIEVTNNSNSIKILKPGFVFATITILDKNEHYKSTPTIRNHKPFVNNNQTEIQNNIWDKIRKKIVNTEGIKKFEEIIKKNYNAFAFSDTDLGCVRDFEHRIDLTSDIPIACRPYRMPHSKEIVVQEQIDKMLKTNVIRPSKSAYAAPCLLVYKKNGKPRLVIDFRRLNKVIQPISYPMPHLETSLQSLGGNKLYTTVDLLSGYHQVPIREQDKHITAFTTGKGLFEFNRVPFGMITSGAIMQLIIERVLAGLNNKICLVYVDDVVIYGKTEEEHDYNLNLVLQRLRENGYKISIDKCVFRAEEVECLGHIISQKGILPNPQKTDSLRNKPIPKTVKEVRQFLGLCGYYRRFVPNYAQIAHPLTDLTKKNKKFIWTPECQAAHENLINQIINPPCLAYPDFSAPFIVTTDASGEGIGAVLSQIIEKVERPIAFYSRRLSETEKKYSPYDQEGYAIKLALQKWRYYLLDHKVIVRTDNQPIIGILKKRDCDGRLGKYLAVIQEYDIQFQYLPGSKNIVADFLSRSWNEAEEINTKYTNSKVENEVSHVTLMKEVHKFDDETFIKEQNEDSKIHHLLNKKSRTFQYFKINKIWYSKNINNNSVKILVPESHTKVFIEHFHVNLGCHQGITKTYKRLNQVCYWPNMKKDIVKFVNNCRICKCSKPDHRAKHKLGSFPLPDKPFHTLHIDLIGPIPNGRYKYKYICVIVDSFSKFVIARPITKKTPEKIIQIIHEEILKQGKYQPELIITDEGGEFTSHKFVDFCSKYNINVHYTSPYHHSSNGAVERFNYSIENLLRCVLLHKKGNWVDHINKITQALNTSVHPSTHYTPYQVLGKKYETGIKWIDNHLEITPHALNHVVINNIKNYQKKIHQTFNKTKRNIKYNVGDTVYAKVSNVNGKLKPLYQGPGVITKMDKYSCFVKFDKNIIRKVHINHLK